MSDTTKKRLTEGTRLTASSNRSALYPRHYLMMAYVVAAAGLTGARLIACVIQAVRAAAVDPVDALRSVYASRPVRIPD